MQVGFHHHKLGSAGRYDFDSKRDESYMRIPERHVSLILRKLLNRGDDRLLFASMIVLAANAGGAWSPMGDVTTTMLWIGGQVSALGIVKALLPAHPLSIFSYP